jgi:hypothetical protein
LQELALYIDPDVDKPTEVDKEPASKPQPPDRVQYPFPFETTMTDVPQRYDLMTYCESALSAASAQPEGRARS